MNDFKKRVLVTAVIAGFAVIGYLMNSQQAVAQGPPGGLAVNIVNPVPLPVTGSTTVSGAVAATQSGAWNVGISGNSTSNPVLIGDVDNAARRPVQTTLCEGNATTSGCGNPDNFAVLADRRMVIEYLSGDCVPLTLNPPTDVSIAVVTTAGGTKAFHEIFPAQRGLGFTVSGQLARIYADPGTSIQLAVGSTNGSARCQIVLSGYSITR
jgi:hypothetical protein